MMALINDSNRSDVQIRAVSRKLLTSPPSTGMDKCSPDIQVVYVLKLLPKEPLSIVSEPQAFGLAISA